MSDADSIAPSGKALPWTEEAKYQLLLRIVGQLMRNGQSINWKEINLPGRTPKSLQHQWAHIRASVAELEKSQGISDGTASAVTKKGAGQKAGKKRGGDELATPETTPQKQKRQRKVLPKSPPTVDESADELAGDDPRQTIKAGSMGSDTTASFKAVNA